MKELRSRICFMIQEKSETGAGAVANLCMLQSSDVYDVFV